MNCSQARKLLSAYVDGELFGREAADIAAHVEACPLCQLEFHDLTRVKDMLAALPVMPAPASLHAGVMARLQQSTATGTAYDSVGRAGNDLASSRPATRRSRALLARFGWGTGVAAAAVAAVVLTWGLLLNPELPPLVADGGQPGSPPDQTVVEQTPPEPTETDPGQIVEPGPQQGGETPDVHGGPTEPAPSEVATEPTPGTSISEPAGSGGAEAPDPDAQSPAGGDETTVPPEFTGGNRFDTAHTQAPVTDRLIAKTAQVSLVMADPETFVVNLVELANHYGVGFTQGDEGMIRLLVPQDDTTMDFIDKLIKLAVPDTFKYTKVTDVDVTEAVRNLTAERDYLAALVATGDTSQQELLEMKEARLAEYFRDIEYLALEITAKGLGD